jgi:hypothetical protein
MPTLFPEGAVSAKEVARDRLKKVFAALTKVEGYQRPGVPPYPKNRHHYGKRDS